LRVVHVCEQWLHSLGGTEYCAGVLEAAAGRARELGANIEVSTELLTGDVIETLIAESGRADSVVLGSRGLGGFAGMALGSVGLGVAGHAEGPVVIVRRSDAGQHGQVVVGCDGSEDSLAAVEYAIEQARARNARLLVVYAWWFPIVTPYYAGDMSVLLEERAQQEIRAARERVISWQGRNRDIEITGEELCEHPVSALTKPSTRADLIVLGSRGLGGFASAMLGSVSHGVLHHAACPVAVVRPRLSRS
jgi:nucleotide-binding universal stress UspA family protein